MELVHTLLAKLNEMPGRYDDLEQIHTQFQSKNEIETLEDIVGINRLLARASGLSSSLSNRSAKGGYVSLHNLEILVKTNVLFSETPIDSGDDFL